MKITEVIVNLVAINETVDSSKPTLEDILKEALPYIKKVLKLDSLPKIIFRNRVPDDEQPTFGRYENGARIIYLATKGRHPLDVLRTLAHELVHYKQDTLNMLDDHSGDTGSPIENQAHAVAGVIMRHINKRHPNFFSADPVQ